MNARLLRYVWLVLLLAIAVSAAGCAAIAGIFKAGVWVGVIIAVILVGGALMLFNMFR